MKNCKSNLKTVSLSTDGSLSIFYGWFVTVSNGTVYLPRLGSTLPLNQANIKKIKNHPYYLHSASITKEISEEEIPVSLEETILYEDSPRTVKVPVVQFKVSPSPDDNVYFCFYLNSDEEITFSSTFNVLKEEWVESLSSSDEYVRVVYASLPFDAPIIIDNRKVICVSPF